jgi:hypothetical protein
MLAEVERRETNEDSATLLCYLSKRSYAAMLCGGVVYEVWQEG